MRRQSSLLFALLLLPALACDPLEEPKEGLVPFADIPADWGQLVAVTMYKDTGYYELWFSNPDTGSLTHVPLDRATWQVKLDRIRTIRRGEALSARLQAAGGGS